MSTATRSRPSLDLIPAHALRRTPALRWALICVSALLTVSAVRVLTGAENLTSPGAMEAAIAATVPIALAGLAGVWAERAGVINIGLEGMMALGTFGAGLAGYQWGPWAGVLAGVVCGAIGGLLLAILAVTFGVDHFIAGITISIVAPGLGLFLAKILYTRDGVQQQASPPVEDVARISIPGFSEWMSDLASRHLFLVSDIAGLLAGVTTQLSVLAVLTAILVAGSTAVLWHTPFGLRLRSTGEAPYAAEALGVNVYRHKYIAVLISGALCGLGGAFLVVGQRYQYEQTAHRGFIGLAAVIFGNWRPGGMAAGAALFGYTDGVRLYDSSGKAIHALLILLALALMLTAFLQYRRGERNAGLGSVVVAVVLAVWFAVSDRMDPAIASIAPYGITLLVMALFAGRMRPPKADGLIYRRGGR